MVLKSLFHLDKKRYGTHLTKATVMSLSVSIAIGCRHNLILLKVPDKQPFEPAISKEAKSFN